MKKFKIKFSNGVEHIGEFSNRKVAEVQAREMAEDMLEEDVSSEALMFDYPLYIKPSFEIEES